MSKFRCSYNLSSVWVAEFVKDFYFWEIAAHSVDHMFSLYCELVLVISRFGFEGWIWVLIASVPDLCIHFIFTITSYGENNNRNKSL